ncbi:MAG: hypothetical protein GF331_23320 [Chitinivibrionales bacterium]|nr:hypothetical protein [Chitinivibrionales bacterium]
MRRTTMKPKVVLIGDSIRMGYQDTVAHELADVAEVWGPAENGGNSRNVLAHLDKWAVDRQPDIVHINCGLHDLRREFGEEANAVPLGEYTENVRAILDRLLEGTNARVVWATTTPVNQEDHHRRKGFDRFAVDVDRYNAAASGVAERLGVVIDDLCAVITAAGPSGLLLDDGVHYSAEGYAHLGRAVAGFLRSVVASC